MTAGLSTGVFRKVVLAVLFLVVGLAAILALQKFAVSTIIVADATLAIYDITGAKETPRRIIGEAAAGEELRVLRCIDLKHYLVPEVALRDSKVGYVLEGAFHLRQKFPWASFGC